MTDDEGGYNGWKNYETWAVALWIDNDEGTLRVAEGAAREALEAAAECEQVRSGVWPLADAPRYLLADMLKGWVEEDLLPDLGASLASDLMAAAVSEVDWQEIAGHYLPERARGRVGCIERVCTCHDDGAWSSPSSYPDGCSFCGCRRPEARS